jgi:hypothetical protein
MVANVSPSAVLASLPAPITIQALTTNSVTLMFETAKPLKLSVRVQAVGASADAHASSSSTPTPASTPIVVTETAPTTRHRFEVHLGAQSGGARYRYTIDGLDAAPGLESAFNAPGGSGKFSFAVVGDSRDHAQWALVAKAILAKSPDFVLVTGDSIEGPYPGDDPSEAAEADWREFFHVAAELFVKVPVYAAQGNHDVGASYAIYNAQPATTMTASAASQSAYSFTWHNAAFVALNTNRAADPDMNAWLKGALTQLSGGPLFVFMHHPLYSCGTHGSSEKLQALYHDVFTQAHVTAVFSGHDHDLIDWGDVDGVHYAVSGGGGTVLYPLNKCDKVPFAQKAYGFVLVEVDDVHIHETFFDVLGNPLYRAPTWNAVGKSFDPRHAAEVLGK